MDDLHEKACRSRHSVQSQVPTSPSISLLAPGHCALILSPEAGLATCSLRGGLAQLDGFPARSFVSRDVPGVNLWFLCQCPSFTEEEGSVHLFITC